VGGYIFSANVLIYRKEEGQMIWLARIKPEHCEGIVKHTILNHSCEASSIREGE
jgi:hypothetical protein